MVADHPTLFRGLGFDAGSGRPVPVAKDRPALVERTDEDFIRRFLDELLTDDGRKRLAGTVRNTSEGAKGLKLYQPVHRSFHLAVFEAACDTFGEPRLDAAKIDSAGLVVRRINPDTGVLEGWMKLGGEVRGWVPLPDKALLEQDPDPTRRKEPFPAGHPEINARLKNTLTAPVPYQESTALLFVAPPDVCAATHRTLVYGLVPLASSELVSAAAAPPPRYEESEVRELLAPYFSESVSVSLEDIAGKTYSANYRDEVRADTSLAPTPRAQAEQRLEQFANLLRKLVSVFNAFENKALRSALNRLKLDYGKGAPRAMGDALEDAAEVFAREVPGKQFVMPKSWPRLSPSDVSTLVRAASDASASRLATLMPQRGRFERQGAKYVVTGFIRVRRDDGCPPALLWSAPSQPFEIAPWYENGKLPPVQIALPPVTRDNVKSFLPNVAFQVPRNIFDLLSVNKPKDFLDQKAKEGGGGGVDWICGFNIPIITLCAFIVLSIFLALLNILFWWLPFIKICFPLPRRDSR